MKFEFEKHSVRPIYDDHGGGGPYRTDYTMKFMVDGIEFTATYCDTVRNIILWHDNKPITSDIKRIGIAGELGKVKDVIRKTFAENEVVNKAFHKLKGDAIDALKEHLCKDLLSNDDWS